MVKPPSDDPRKHTVCIRLTDREHAELAKLSGHLSVSEFIRIKIFGRWT